MNSLALKRTAGFTVMEITFALAMLSLLSFFIFKSVRISHHWLNVTIAERQASSLLTLLRVDFELANAERQANGLPAITAVQDFFDYMYTKQWPREAASIFNGVSEGVEGGQTLSTNVDGCITNISELRPCFNSQQGIWVEFDAQQAVAPSAFSLGREARVQRVSIDARGGQNQFGLNNPVFDAKLFQTYYFAQTVSAAAPQLDEDDDRTRGSSARGEDNNRDDIGSDRN